MEFFGSFRMRIRASLVQLIQGYNHGHTADELRNHSEFHEILGQYLAQDFSHVMLSSYR